MKNGQRIGRPPLAPEEKRSEVISVRVTPALMAEIDLYAKTFGRTLGGECERAINNSYRRTDQDSREASDFMATALEAFYEMTEFLRSESRADLKSALETAAKSEDKTPPLSQPLLADTRKMNTLIDMAVLFFEAMLPRDETGEIVTTRERWEDLDQGYWLNLRDQVNGYLRKTEGMGSTRWNLRFMLKGNGHQDFQEDLIISRETIGDGALPDDPAPSDDEQE